MNPTLGLLALAITFLAVAHLPVPTPATVQWLGAVAAIICGILAALFGFAVIAA